MIQYRFNASILESSAKKQIEFDLLATNATFISLQVDPLTVIKTECTSKDDSSRTREEIKPKDSNLNTESLYVSDSDNSDSSKTIYEIDIITDIESDDNYKEEVSDTDSDIEEVVIKEDTGRMKSCSNVSGFVKLKENVKVLISAYKNRPFLWNKNYAFPINKSKRETYLKEIAQELKEQRNLYIKWKLIENVIKFLRRNYQEDLKALSSGVGKYVPAWYFNDLNFLRPFMENNLITKLDSHLPDLTPEKIIKILEIYKGYPHLWNTHLIEYYCKNKRHASKQSMLEKLETNMDIKISEHTLEDYFRTINNCFARAKSKKLENKITEEHIVSEEASSNQKDYYEHMIFLYDHVGKFKCSECPSSFKTSIYLKLHKAQVHGSEPLVCSLCNKEFRAANSYINHAKRHMEDFNQECKECGKKFLQPSDLQIHMRNHTGAKPFCCEMCGASFRHYQGFTIHQKRHAKNYMYFCDYCNKGFYTKGRYENHMNAHTYNRLQTCYVCRKTFMSKKPLKKQAVITQQDVRINTCNQCLKQESINREKPSMKRKIT